MPNFFIFGHGCYDASRPPIVLGRNTLYFKSSLNSPAQACAVDQDLDTTHYHYKVGGGVSNATVEEYIIDFVDDVASFGFASFNVIMYDESTGQIDNLNYHMRKGVYLSDILKDITQKYGDINKIYLTVCRGPCHEDESNDESEDVDVDEGKRIRTNFRIRTLRKNSYKSKKRFRHHRKTLRTTTKALAKAFVKKLKSQRQRRTSLGGKKTM